MEYLLISYRTILFYFIVVIVYRIMGKREVGQLGIIDLIVSMLIAELVAISIENYHESLFLYLWPIFLLTIIQVILACISEKNIRIKKYIDGEPSIIIKNGILNFKEMITQRYSLDDLLSQLREKGISTIESVEHAILETNGKLSVFRYNRNREKSSFPLPLIIDGKIQYNTLKEINKNKKWLTNYLEKKELDVDNIFYAFFKTNSMYVIKKDDMKKSI